MLLRVWGSGASGLDWDFGCIQGVLGGLDSQFEESGL